MTITIDKDTELSSLRQRAKSIITQNESLEITIEQARRKVQLLLRDMKTWARQNNVTLQTQTRTYKNPPTHRTEPLTADRCPLFFKEELQELCPLDLARSEVWGGQVVFCRYYCE